MREWFRETHGCSFELLRHFIRRFFDSEFIISRGQIVAVLCGTVPVFAQWFFLLIGPLKHKYDSLSQMPSPALYREALRSDELWLITLMMSAIGLLTAIKWQALFPDSRDYHALGTLPLRPSRIFAAKFGALLLVATATLVVVNFLPCIAFPALSGGRWAAQPHIGARVLAHAGASFAASAFAFFALAALQGLLLNVLQPRAFGRITGYVQGLLVAMLLGASILSFSIQPKVTNVVTQPEWSTWLPPVWFLGLYESLAREPDSSANLLAGRAIQSLLVAVALAVITYVLSYRRHQTLLIEGASGRARESRWSRAMVRLLARKPREQAIAGFMLDTAARSRHHRMILMAYGGIGFALLLTGIEGIGKVVVPDRTLLADFVYYHMLALLLLLISTRHVFSLPTELKANWIFQITEASGREEWFAGLDRLVLFWGSLLLLAVPAPLEFRLLGPRAAADMILFAALGLLAYEFAFASWDKLPFTCSYLPNAVPVWMILAFFGLAGVFALLSTVLMDVLTNPLHYVLTLAGVVALWARKLIVRRDSWEYLRLCYEDTPEPAVKSLDLLK